jgi:hypothetical protein
MDYWCTETGFLSNSSVCYLQTTERKLRKKMADLLTSRITLGPPFSVVGVDTFGTWNIVEPKTMGD